MNFDISKVRGHTFFQVNDLYKYSKATSVWVVASKGPLPKQQPEETLIPGPSHWTQTAECGGHLAH